jgi:hypothetical protein
MRNLKIITYQETYNQSFDREDIFNLIANQVRDSYSVDLLYFHPLEPIGNPVDVPSEKDYEEYYKKALYEFESFLVERDIMVYFLFGGSKLFDSWGNGGDYVIKNVKILTWNTFLLHYSGKFLINSYKTPIKEININTDFEKLFFSLNRHPRSQRSLIMDTFCKNDLFDFGTISWNKLSNEWHEPYEFNCWEEKRMVLDMSENIDQIDSVNERVDFNTDFLINNRCLFNVVGETMIGNHEVFISEKTYKNFLIGQPFISVGSLYHNQQLKNLGFKLYDEIFDYSYDSYIDAEKRVVGMVENLSQYKHVDLLKLYDQIKEITNFNKNKSVEYYENDPYIPLELITLYKSHSNVFDDNKFIKMECDLQDIFKNKI